ncbi:MAG: PSD1 domain-containing protein [Planctomycetaceae bacterium]|nr:PSD1 domain-containing protein [Planctomycetaceae bacterium]
MRDSFPYDAYCRCQIGVVAVVWLVVMSSPASHADDADGVRFFREKIEPVLKAQCYSCHSRQAEEVKGGLRLDFKAGVLRGGDSGPAVVAGKSGESLLIQAIRHEGGMAMPPKKERKLSDKTIADFVKWVEMGAPDPRDREPTDAEDSKFEEARRHWAFQPIRKPTVPGGADFKLQIANFKLQIGNEADKRTLIRRVTFDLIGLPPTPEEVEAFVGDESAEAYEKVVDRLLGSRHFGEKAAQQWLDVVRFAETEGYEYDRHIPDAWRYRDYVIDSFNKDKPFDRFLTEQLAGDEIAPENRECLTASIFHRLGPVRRNAGNTDIALSRNEVLTERTDILGAAILGLTVGCARCHNHKLEPITQKDYYRLQAYLAATEEHNLVLASTDEQQAWEAETKKVKDEIARVQKLIKDATNAAEKDRLMQQAEDLDDKLPAPLPTIPSTHNDFAKRTAIHVLKRGVWENKGEPVQPRPLSVLVADDTPELSPGETQPRTQLAKWLTSPNHPLTARVIVNRVWQQHFGVGLVKTANDFGLKGEKPSDPELLDWLAATLIDNGWRLKPLHRVMVLSAKYVAWTPSAEGGQATKPRRLSAEEIRDAMLAVSGRLNPKAGGPSVIVPVDPDLVGLLYKPSQWAITADASEHDRRSVYLIAKRNLRLPFFENLDAPALQTSCARRESSTHPPQALELLNGTLANDLALAFAKRLEKDCDSDRERIIDSAFRLALGRPPTTKERERSLAFLREQPLSEFALAMFNLNEFVYIR